jgi:transitional endoplasmic reticulum ATPase
MTTDHFETPYSRRIALWVLRLCTSSVASRYFMKEDCFRDHDVAQFLGLPHSYDVKDRAKISKLLVKMLNELEAKGVEQLDPSTEENLAAFSSALNLNATESKVLEFFILADVDSILCDSIRMLDSARTEKHIQLLSKILKIDENEIASAIKKGSWLRQSGLITLSIRGSDKLGELEFFCSDVARSLIRDSLDQDKIISVMGVNQSDTPTLTMADYKHVESSTSLMIDYLREVVTSGKRGVNILIHGDPGTGKTQLTRVVAKELGVPLFDFAVFDSDGDPKRPKQRLTSMRVAEAFFKNRQALFVFDEFEDAISPSDGDRSSLSGQKGWFNHILENNTKPVFWLSNSISFLDPAYVRRFDFIIEVPIPPRSSRERILQQRAGKHLSKPAIQRLSQIEELAPAVVTRITEVFDVVSKNVPQNQRDEIFTKMVGMTLKSQGHEMPSAISDEILPKNVYDTACLNTGTNLPEISRMLQKHPHARLCLYGPPGTGKSAFGYWLAREIDRPLHVKRASDLLSP